MSSHLAKSSPHFQIACVISVTKSPLAGLGIAIEKMFSIIPPESLHSCSRSFYSPVSSLEPLKFSLKIDYCLLAGGTFCWVKVMALREWCGPVLPWINSTVFTRKSETFISIPLPGLWDQIFTGRGPWVICMHFEKQWFKMLAELETHFQHLWCAHWSYSFRHLPIISLVLALSWAIGKRQREFSSFFFFFCSLQLILFFTLADPPPTPLLLFLIWSTWLCFAIQLSKSCLLLRVFLPFDSSMNRMDFSVSDHCCSFPAFLLRLLRCWLSSLRLCVTASPLPDHRLLVLVRTTHLTLAAAKVVSRCDPSTNCQGHSLGRSNLTLWANGTCLSYHTKQPALPHSLFLHISSLTSCLSLSLVSFSPTLCECVCYMFACVETSDWCRYLPQLPPTSFFKSGFPTEAGTPSWWANPRYPPVSVCPQHWDCRHGHLWLLRRG